MTLPAISGPLPCVHSYSSLEPATGQAAESTERSGSSQGVDVNHSAWHPPWTSEVSLRICRLETRVCFSKCPSDAACNVCRAERPPGQRGGPASLLCDPASRVSSRRRSVVSQEDHECPLVILLDHECSARDITFLCSRSRVRAPLHAWEVPVRGYGSHMLLVSEGLGPACTHRTQ